MQLEINSKLGQCAFALSLEIIEGQAEQAKRDRLAATQLLFHAVPSGIFNKETKLDRESAFSDQLAKLVEKSIGDSMSGMFKVVKFDARQYVKAENKASLEAQLKSLGYSPEDIAKIKAGKQEPEVEEQVEAESV